MRGRWWLAGSFFLFAFALLLPWWIVRVGSVDVYEAGAYTTASASLGSVLDGPAILAGILVTTALLATLVGLAAAQFVDRPDVARAGAFVALAAGAVGLIVAPVTWPEAWAKEVASRTQRVEGEDATSPIDASWWGRVADVSFRAGVGWYAGLLGTGLLVPVVLGLPRVHAVPSLPRVKP